MGMSNAVLADSLTYYLTTDSVAARPAAWTVSLHTGDPGEDGTANELAYAGYARQAATFVLSEAPATPKASNDTALTFPASTAGYVATHLAVWGGSTPLVIQQLRSSKTVPADETAELAVGELTIGGDN